MASHFTDALKFNLLIDSGYCFLQGSNSVRIRTNIQETFRACCQLKTILFLAFTETETNHRFLGNRTLLYSALLVSRISDASRMPNIDTRVGVGCATRYISHIHEVPFALKSFRDALVCFGKLWKNREDRFPVWTYCWQARSQAGGHVHLWDPSAPPGATLCIPCA